MTSKSGKVSTLASLWVEKFYPFQLKIFMQCLIHTLTQLQQKPHLTSKQTQVPSYPRDAEPGGNVWGPHKPPLAAP